jgi:hypothetical protein
MRSLVLTLATLSATLAILAAPHDKALESARKELTARYAGISRAFEKKDATGMNEPLAADYELKQPDGRVIKRDAIASGMAQQMNMMSNAKWTRKIESLELKGADAVVSVRGTFDSEFAQQGKNHKFHMNTVTTDTWTKLGKKWMLRSSKVIENRVEVDGMPAGPPAR